MSQREETAREAAEQKGVKTEHLYVQES